MTLGCFGSGSIFFLRRPTITSTLRSNGKLLRPDVEQEVAAQNPAGPAHEFAQKREFAPRERDRLAEFTLEGARVEVDNKPREGKRSARPALRARANLTRCVRLNVHHSGPRCGSAADY
jgi:hypothetical protein